MRVQDIEIFLEGIDVDNATLEEMLIESNELVKERKRIFDIALKNFDSNNYQDFLISKLYYEFAKEENDKIIFETNKRNTPA